MPYSNNLGGFGGGGGGGSLAIGSAVTGGTDGSILFVQGGNLSQDNANLFYDDTNNRLGLLTASPTHTLHIGTGGSLRLQDMTQGSVFFAGANGVFTQDNTNFFWDDTNNRLGILTAAPTDTLDIGGTGTLRLRAMTQGSVFFAGANGVLTQDNTNFFYDDANNQLQLGAGANALPSYTFKTDTNTGLFLQAADILAFTTGGVNRARINSNGTLLVGDDNATDAMVLLDINRNGGSGDVILRINSGGSSEYRFGIKDSNDIFYLTNNNGPTAFGTSKRGIMIDTNGNVGVLMEPTGTYALDVKGNASLTRTASGLFLNFTDGTDTFGFFNATATPESAIAANIGSLTLDTANAVPYIKTTDTTNTGWKQVTVERLRTAAANTTATAADHVIEVDSTSNPVTVTLPSTLPQGKCVIITWIAGSNPVTIAGSGINVINNAGAAVASWNFPALYSSATYFRGSINWQLT